METEYLTRSVSPCLRGVRSHPLTDESTLRHSHISGDQSRRPDILHRLWAKKNLYLPPPHYACKLCELIRSCARELIVYFMPNNTARSEGLIIASDRFFCVIKQYSFHVCVCVETLMLQTPSDSPACNESVFLSFFLFWQVSLSSCHQSILCSHA